MGTLTYANELEIAFEDRALAHLQIVIGAKLRRGESFFFTWLTSPGARAIWMSPTIPLMFTYSNDSKDEINREWVEGLSRSANSNGGLKFAPEPEPGADG